jgi:VWFA-related protein
MIRRFVERLVGLLASLAVLAWAGTRAQQATFRSESDAAWMAVTVVDQTGHLLTDLRKEDFEIEERGVLREITTFRSDPIPFAAVVMVDISGSMEGASATVHRAMDELINRFEPGDRARIGSFDSVPFIAPSFTANRETLHRDLSEFMLAPLQLCNGLDVKRMMMRGATALWDGIGCAIDGAANDAETPRRVVIAISDGIENFSGMKLGEVIDRADRYGVMVYGIGLAGSDGIAASDLRGLAESTGGGYYDMNHGGSLEDAMRQIGDELRHQYVLGFSPLSSDRTVRGVTVRSLRAGTRAHARQVFLTTAPINSSTALVPPRSSAAPVSGATTPVPTASGRPEIAASAPLPGGVRSPVLATLDRFVSPNWIAGHMPALSIDQLRALHRDLRRDAAAWIDSGPASDQPRRRLAIGAFVLDLLSSQKDPYLWSSNQAAWDLLDWTEGMLREGPPLPAERQWYLGAMALLERADAAKELELFVGRAQGRFPNDERWSLARGLAQELTTWPQNREGPTFAPPPTLSSLIVGRYEEASALPSVRQEALLRLGFFELRRGRVDVALGLIDQVGQPREQFMRYWLGLIRGRALEQAGRIDEAVTSYQTAFDEVPFARSATTALAAALLAAHRGDEAQKLAARMLASPVPPDPWIVYVLPDWRFWSLLTEQLRKAVAS